MSLAALHEMLNESQKVIQESPSESDRTWIIIEHTYENKVFRQMLCVAKLDSSHWMLVKGISVPANMDALRELVFNTADSVRWLRTDEYQQKMN